MEPDHAPAKLSTGFQTVHAGMRGTDSRLIRINPELNKISSQPRR
jgi:hypothetical protein